MAVGMATVRAGVRVSRRVWVAAGFCVLFVLVVWVEPSSLSAQGSDAVYEDVDPGSAHFGDIVSLAADGVFDGTECGPGRFCPNEGLSRRVFAVWLVRVLDGEDPSVPRQDLSRFEDVDADGQEASHIVRLAELGVTVGCSSSPPRFCPDQFVSRAQMASLLVRAFGMPQAEPAGFGDVGVGDTHADAIDRLASVGVTKGCSADPLLYCPGEVTTRGQMASFLARAIRWRHSLDSTQPAVAAPGAPSGVSAALGDGDKTVRLSWSGPAGEVDSYVVQWRHGAENFGEHRQLILQPADLASHGLAYGTTLTMATFENACMVRVVAVNAAGSGASEETWIPTGECSLRRVIEQYLVLEMGEEFPWLREVWVHMSQPGFTLAITDNPRAPPGFARAGLHIAQPLNYTVGYLVIIKRGLASYSLRFPDEPWDTYIHEMAHVYTLTNNIASHPGPLGVAHLYFSQVANTLDSDWCSAEELYADAILSYTLPESSPTYLYNCIRADEAFEEAVEVARQALNGQMPDWLYETYRGADGSLDLDAIWAEVKAIKDDGVSTTVAYRLRNEFGGYCSPAQVRFLLLSSSDELDNP